ncbi:clathrin light chain A-like isoform X1 [Crassostrea angulata]|uniref:clathrin light chain A-like isoform X1 n=1 Tax=Magallana angulata TaxID=2784310 RepID=UPI0005C368BF|nr:clathrin light chain A isoform X1 [Crassostrea gigas]XP_052684727.1 clathrin light chain A-like isoform X1 [Crassostrea angulata]|eukprot:XP_011447727.1 PREDICTED: clathrin light chain A isoform X1 [Crassostrea gigas]
MSEFDAFDSEPPAQNTEEDPAAAFLAREQSELAGLEDDNVPQDNGGGEQFDMFDDGEPQMMNGAPDFMGENQFEESQSNGPSDAYSAISSVDKERAEPEKLRIWREEQKMRLEKKDAEEAQKKEAWREAAKKELDDWYKHHNEQVQKTRETNRKHNMTAEEAFKKDRDTTQPGGEWEKICRICEFNPKNSKNTKDVSRLRSILLQLKQTPLVR